jgi:elongation factor P
MYGASDLRKGLKIELEGVPYEITEFQFVKPGKGQAMYKTKIRNLLTGATQDRTFREVEKIGKPDLIEKDLIFSYQHGDDYVFSDPDTYEETTLTAEQLGTNTYFIVEDMSVAVLFYNGKPIDITLPFFVEKEITETEPGVRGDTATNVTKPAFIDNGYELAVPLFINQGDIVRIDTRTGKYADRVAAASKK